jgi:hypothetical protein
MVIVVFFGILITLCGDCDKLDREQFVGDSTITITMIGYYKKMTIRINVQMNAFHKTLKFSLDGKDYDISNQIPEEIWNIGDRKFSLHPFKDWEMRTELRKVFIKYFRENINENLDEDDVIF